MLDVVESGCRNLFGQLYPNWLGKTKQQSTTANVNLIEINSILTTTCWHCGGEYMDVPDLFDLVRKLASTHQLTHPGHLKLTLSHNAYDNTVNLIRSAECFSDNDALTGRVVCTIQPEDDKALFDWAVIQTLPKYRQYLKQIGCATVRDVCVCSDCLMKFLGHRELDSSIVITIDCGTWCTMDLSVDRKGGRGGSSSR